MARTSRLSTAAVLAVLLAFARLSAADPPANEPQPVANALAVQDAMRQGRDLLQQGNAKAAVEALEAQLSRINGNPSYLALLREAYYAYIKELQLAHQNDLCKTYLKRLQVIDKDARLDGATTAPRPAPSAVRGVRDDDPLQQTPRRTDPAAAAHLAAAEQAFAARRYAEAGNFYARAAAADAALSAEQRKQWAYCRLFAVHARLDQPGATAAGLEQEIAAALQIADNDAKLVPFGRQLLDRVRQRAGPATAQIVVRHAERDATGWARAESPNFRVHHVQKRELAEQVARAAEAARAAAFERWSGPPRGDWKPGCNVYLFATGADYAKATNQSAISPGHATYKAEGGAIAARRLDLRADEPNLLAGVVPHEATHLVLGDLFAEVPLPRWADEGMAVLSEPRGRIDRYVQTLNACRQRGQLLPLEKLLAKAEYPDAASVTVFFVESVSVVDYLVGVNGPRTFVEFMHDAQRGNLDAALKKHYQCANVAELQARWLRKLYPQETARGVSGP
jgi:hypothetical protein